MPLQAAGSGFACRHGGKLQRRMRWSAACARFPLTRPSVREKAKDFDALNTWHPAVATDEIVAGSNNQPGAERKLTPGNGGTVEEKLLSFDDAHRRFSYAIVGGVLPVSDYTSTFRVTPVGKDSARVTWSGTFKRKDTGAKPAADANDATAIKTISGVYQVRPGQSQEAPRDEVDGSSTRCRHRSGSGATRVLHLRRRDDQLRWRSSIASR